MKRSFGHEDAGLATPETLNNIVKNFTIRSFLETNDKRYLVGPKGSGKTLLLLRKAIDQRKKGGAICIPSDSNLPVDRLTASRHVGKRFNYTVSDESESSLAWTSIWKHSIFRSVLHHLRDKILTDIDECLPSRTSDSWRDELEFTRLKSARKLVDRLIPAISPNPCRPYYYLTELCDRLDSSPKNVLRTVRNENEEVDALLSTFSREVYVFMDNLDDYYEREPDLWFNSMYGQFRAIREISLTHRNIHLFTSVRSDVYRQFSDELQLQYFDYIAPLEYTKDELLNIFAVHIQELDSDLLEIPKLQKTDPWKAFFGDCIIIPNYYIGGKENIKDYIHRHTLGRPRDMVHVGTVLLMKRPETGFVPDLIRNTVIIAEEHIAEQYIAEVKPMLDQRFDIKELVRNYLPFNIMTSDDIKKTMSVYIKSRHDLCHVSNAPSDLTRPFATLYELGLLGIAQRKVGTKEIIQYFEPPGKGLSNPKNRDLPISKLYFLHPVLNHLLPRDRKSDKIIVGNDLPVTLFD